MDDYFGVPPLMETSPGITVPHITREPLGDEGEMTVGPDNVNPYNSPEEAELTEAIERKQKERNGLYKTVPQSIDTSVEDPTEGDDPFVFDDVDEEVDRLQLPFAESNAPTFDENLFRW